jgi:hypothetical protein
MDLLYSIFGFLKDLLMDWISRILANKPFSFSDQILQIHCLHPEKHSALFSVNLSDQNKGTLGE